MSRHIIPDELASISECLEALAEINVTIESIQIQLDFPDPDRGESWRQSAEYALRVCKKIKCGIDGRLAVLRQLEKKQETAQAQRHNDFLVLELARYVPDVVFRACDYRARIKASSEV
ncbi:hypothetical protein B1H58_13245 [Pantoea alhagi]|uniref:Uncharacterized protein n=1 Tax=Pantoea alhagi TaxID=1891675 RepID=A0A1W6B761_9GAMM|nr:hypothetical protein [Pantoea alhagi]ARJ42894.1 hypothetical protein B1H58_13245 [Pantoea alhagi]